LESELALELAQQLQQQSDDPHVADGESPWTADFDGESSSGPWGPSTGDDRQYDQETVDLLKAEIDDLRAMLAERDSHIEELTLPGAHTTSAAVNTDQQTAAYQQRIDNLLAEATEQDERFSIVHDLLEAAELNNQAEADERQAFEAWVGEIEHRIGQREAEWQAQLAATRERLQDAEKQRDQLQHQMREVASRFGAQDVYRETLDKLQSQNAQLQDDLEVARKQHARVKQQLDNLQNREADDIQQERALIAKERASVSRLRFELSRKLSEFEQTLEPKNSADQEVDLRVRALRSHLREIHQQEKQTQEQKGDSLFTRISGLWKRMDDEY
jgi:chromosome segregation ATPase